MTFLSLRLFGTTVTPQYIVFIVISQKQTFKQNTPSQIKWVQPSDDEHKWGYTTGRGVFLKKLAFSFVFLA